MRVQLYVRGGGGFSLRMGPEVEFGGTWVGFGGGGWEGGLVRNEST